jgi:hypothetical protein
MRNFIIALVAVLIFTHYTHAEPHHSAKRCNEQNKEIASLIRQYQVLRDRRRQLRAGGGGGGGGGGGVLDADLDSDKGKLHEVLYKLGAELGHAPYTKEKMITCLGTPDATKNEKQMNGLLEIYKREKRIAGQKVKEYRDPEYLIYFWRGWHDFLFFISEDGLIVDHGWWFAYE